MAKHKSGLKNSLLLVLSLVLFSCVEPVDLKLPTNVRNLVVQGLVTNEPGPYTVELSMTAPYGRPTGLKDVELEGAQVEITSSTGEREVLSEHGLGIFKTLPNGIRGKVGEAYTLQVRLKDGRSYTSTAQLLTPSPEVENIQLQFQKVPLQEGETTQNYRYEVSVDVTDPALEKNYYRWEWGGIFEVSTQPWDYEYWPPLGNGPIPMPKSCCKTCWVYDTIHVTEVGEDRLFDGNRYRQIIGYLPLTAENINVRYRLDVAQYSVSAEAYDFWRVFISQTRNTGSVLDPPPANPRGNITSTSDPDEPVYGYFGASAVTRKTIFINREDVPVVPPLLKYPDDCLTMKFSTTIRPSFW
ncbi:DUF4249 domain-containing protein [Rufibacter latericius]|uniref:DUF4249 domain-containing protein n=1 Tax=Rufibacter latericius TaxID=2487040 RepID=A0A3M9N0N6_9BACT|nr:DUF4249 domain-containing protein [Rufibacter latericius]RNI31351.1 DUF4249 domain-containing protein [Rufibacter latericius]